MECESFRMNPEFLKTSALVSRIQPSATLQLAQKVRAMNAAGSDIVDLTVGEPEGDTPSWASAGALEAVERGDTRYPPVGGTLALKQAVQAWYGRMGCPYAPDQILVCNGAKQVLFNALVATLDPGDRVVLPAPYWTSYLDMVAFTGAVADVVPCSPEEGFRMTPAQLAQALRPETRWVLLSSPHNPTGALYTDSGLAELAQVLEQHPHVMVLSDEIYDSIRYDGQPPTTLVKVAPALAERTLVVNGVSKTFAMTGWRVGYGLGPAPLIRAMETLQSQSTSGVCTLAQAAATRALRGLMEEDDACPQGHGPRRQELEARRALWQARRDRFVKELREHIPWLICAGGSPGGAFYLYLNCAPLLDRVSVLQNDQDAAAWILEHARVACVPGSVFGMSPWVRMAYAVPDERLDLALARLKEAGRRVGA
jgi:aspartate aminotransferase